jgi:hypothetical protein
MYTTCFSHFLLSRYLFDVDATVPGGSGVWGRGGGVVFCCAREIFQLNVLSVVATCSYMATREATQG